MFRDLKEYQEIAKIYADKVSKPENLDERRGSSVEQLKQNRADAIPNKPAPAPQKGAGGGVGNPTNTRGTGTKEFEFKKPNTSASNKRAQMSIKRRTPVNTDSTGKRIPTTAEIRAKAKGKVGGGNAGASTDSGGTSMAAIKQKASSSMEAGAFDAKDSSSTPQAKPKMGSPDSKFIKRSKGPGFVKRGTPGAQRAENLEKNRNRAKEMAKARIAAKKAAMSEGIVDKGMDNLKKNIKIVAQGIGGAGKKIKNTAVKVAKEVKKGYDAQEGYTPYDIVLEYLLSTEQVATIEEANYVMTEMDAETIQAIVKEGSMDVPPDVKAAAKRQYKAGSPGAEPYTVDDKKTIINYYKNKKGKV